MAARSSSWLRNCASAAASSTCARHDAVVFLVDLLRPSSAGGRHLDLFEAAQMTGCLLSRSICLHWDATGSHATAYCSGAHKATIRLWCSLDSTVTQMLSKCLACWADKAARDSARKDQHDRANHSQRLQFQPKAPWHCQGWNLQAFRKPAMLQHGDCLLG